MADKKITEFRFSDKDLDILRGLSAINDKVYISPDMVQTVEGTLVGTSDGAANNRCNNGSASAVYKFETPFFFVDDLGIGNLPLLISTITTFKKDHIIEVYPKNLVIRDEVSSVRFWLTPPEANQIPRVDMERIVARVKSGTTKVHFKLDWNLLDRVFRMQKIIGSKTIFIYKNEDDLVIKVASQFAEDGNNTATIRVPADNIISDTLDYLNGTNEDGTPKYVEFRINDLDKILVPDDYEIILVERGICYVGTENSTYYMFKANYVEPQK